MLPSHQPSGKRTGPWLATIKQGRQHASLRQFSRVEFNLTYISEKMLTFEKNNPKEASPSESFKKESSRFSASCPNTGF